MEKRTSRTGQRLGNYQLLRLLGEGGFAQVYLGEHIHLGTWAAIKVLHTRLASSDVEAFRAEARTIARLVHPHIVRVLEFDVEENTPFLVMDYAVNGNLRRKHPKGSILPIETVVSYVQQISEALQYAHDNKVVHRDIKPENMLLSQNQQVLLSDFGIAITLQSSRDRQAQAVVGTVTYMSPEHIKGTLHPASDQYALGVVVYEWLCGEPPFRGSFPELCTQHLSAPPPPLREKLPTISSGVEQVVMTALAKEPEQRFSSIRTFATALQQASQARPGGFVQILPPIRPSASSRASSQSAQHSEQRSSIADEATQRLKVPQVAPSPVPKAPIPMIDFNNQTPQPSPHLKRRAVIIAGLGGLFAAGIGLSWLVNSRNGQSSTSTTPLSPTATKAHTIEPASTADPASKAVALYSYKGHDGAVNVISWSHDGRWIASGGGDKAVQIREAAQGKQILTYHGHTDAVHGLAWSPDGTRIASGSFDKTVRVWDVADGGRTFTYVYTGHGNQVEEVAWSHDGKRIAVIGVRTMEVWNATDGSQQVVIQRGLGAAKTVAWSPDDRLLASGGDVTVYVWDAATSKQVLKCSGHTDRVDTVAWSPDGKRLASAGKDKTVRVWDATNGKQLVIYLGHTNYVNSIVWSPDGRKIASGSDDNTVQVWDATNGDPIFTYRGHGSDVNTVVWSPDGNRIASGGDAGNVHVWTAPQSMD